MATSLLPERSVLKTAPSVEPLTLAELKIHLRVAGSVEDDYITALGKAARRRVEDMTGRALINQTWYLYLDEWPDGDRIRLPRAPLSSVTSVTYKDTDGTATTWAASNYIVDTNPIPGEVVKAYSKTWPNIVLYPASPITVEYVAGYGAAATSVPEELKQALYLLTAHYYEQREPLITGTIVAAVPMQVEWLLGQFMVEWWRP